MSKEEKKILDGFAKFTQYQTMDGRWHMVPDNFSGLYQTREIYLDVDKDGKCAHKRYGYYQGGNPSVLVICSDCSHVFVKPNAPTPSTDTPVTSKWEKLNAAFDEALDSMTSEDWQKIQDRYLKMNPHPSSIEDITKEALQKEAEELYPDFIVEEKESGKLINLSEGEREAHIRARLMTVNIERESVATHSWDACIEEVKILYQESGSIQVLLNVSKQNYLYSLKTNP